MPLLGLDYEPSQLDWAAAERHNLGGNRMRRTASSDIVVRDEWRDKIGLPRRALIDLLTLPATYGTRQYLARKRSAGFKTRAAAPDRQRIGVGRRVDVRYDTGCRRTIK